MTDNWEREATWNNVCAYAGQHAQRVYTRKEVPVVYSAMWEEDGCRISFEMDGPCAVFKAFPGIPVPVGRYAAAADFCLRETGRRLSWFGMDADWNELACIFSLPVTCRPLSSDTIELIMAELLREIAHYRDTLRCIVSGEGQESGETFPSCEAGADQDLPQLSVLPKEAMDIQVRSLSRYFEGDGHHGFFMEAFTPEGLPCWYVSFGASKEECTETGAFYSYHLWYEVLAEGFLLISLKEHPGSLPEGAACGEELEKILAGHRMATEFGNVSLEEDGCFSLNVRLRLRDMLISWEQIEETEDELIREARRIRREIMHLPSGPEEEPSERMNRLYRI